MASTHEVVGTRAPSFTLPDPQGAKVSLEDLLGEGPVVLFIVPRPETGVCAATARGLRDHHEELEAAGVRVIGISPMSQDVHRGLCRDHRLPFVHLTDRGYKVARSYGVRPTLKVIPGRATFVLDAAGTIVWEERNPISAKRHVDGALSAVRRLMKER